MTPSNDPLLESALTATRAACSREVPRSAERPPSPHRLRICACTPNHPYASIRCSATAATNRRERRCRSLRRTRHPARSAETARRGRVETAPSARVRPDHGAPPIPAGRRRWTSVAVAAIANRRARSSGHQSFMSSSGRVLWRSIPITTTAPAALDHFRAADTYQCSAVAAPSGASAAT
jgi:hypothetical protein